jgi:hypothetical protein
MRMSRIRCRRAVGGACVTLSAIVVGVAAVPGAEGASPLLETTVSDEESVSFMAGCLPAGRTTKTSKTAARAALRGGYPERVSRATASMCGVCGNMSTGRTDSSR